MKIENADMGIISNCPLCGSHSLHLMKDDLQTQQCINCGYATSNNLKEELKDDVFKTLSEEMKSWSEIKSGKIWLPSFITLPIGMVFPVDDEDENGKSMRWGFAPMVEIPKEEQSNFPIDGKDGEFHTQKYDTDNSEIFDEFIMALSKMNELAKYLESQ